MTRKQGMEDIVIGVMERLEGLLGLMIAALVALYTKRPILWVASEFLSYQIEILREVDHHANIKDKEKENKSKNRSKQKPKTISDELFNLQLNLEKMGFEFDGFYAKVPSVKNRAQT